MDQHKIIVFGASGFLGKEVISQLKKQKILFVACNKLKKKGFKQIDITKAIDLNSNFDIVVHLAGINYAPNPRLYYEVNYKGTKNILDFSVKNNVKKIIFASSCSVYGQKLKGTITETTKGRNLSDYGKSKYLAEKEILAYNKKYGLDYVILRFPTLIGKNETNNRLTKIIKEYKSQNNLHFEKDSTFMITDVKDAAELVIQSIKKRNGIYNAITHVITISKVVDILNKITGNNKQPAFTKKSKSKLEFDLKKIYKNFRIQQRTLTELIKQLF